MQVDLVALPLHLVDFALAVLLAARLERQHVCVLGEVLELSQQLSGGHSPRVAWPYSFSDTSSSKGGAE